MSAEERQQILKMLEQGKITPEQALALIKELDQDAAVDEAASFIASGAGPSAARGETFGSSPSSAPELERTASQARGLWQIPLWIGMGLTVLTAYGIFALMQSDTYNFWFFCLWIPFMLGVALMALAGWSRTARWLFVNVDRSRTAPDSGPRRIFLGFPLPLNLAAWLMRVFGRYIPGVQDGGVDGIVEAITLANSMDEPLIVNVDDSEDGERVQVFIG